MAANTDTDVRVTSRRGLSTSTTRYRIGARRPPGCSLDARRAVHQLPVCSHLSTKDPDMVDLLFVLLTLGVFALLALVVKGVEKL